MPFVLSLSKHRPSAAPQERTALRQAQGERMRGSYPLFRAFLTLWLLIAGATFVRAETVVFTDVNVVPLDRERVIPRTTVIVTDGEIASIRTKAKRSEERCVGTEWVSTCRLWGSPYQTKK